MPTLQQEALFAVLAAAFVVPSLRGRRRRQSRPAVLGRLGFAEIPPGEVGGMGVAMPEIADEMRWDRPPRPRLPWAARGRTAAGEALLFDAVMRTNTDHLEFGQTVLALRAPAALPAFALRHMDMLDRRLHAGLHPLGFPGHERFGRDFWVFGPDEAAIRGVFGPDVLAVIEADGDRRLCLERRQDWLLVYRHHQMLAPDGCAALVRFGERLGVAMGLPDGPA